MLALPKQVKAEFSWPELGRGQGGGWELGMFIKTLRGTSLASPVVQELACQCREHRFDLWSGKIPHAWKQLSRWLAITAEALNPKVGALQPEKPPQ